MGEERITVISSGSIWAVPSGEIPEGAAGADESIDVVM